MSRRLIVKIDSCLPVDLMLYLHLQMLFIFRGKHALFVGRRSE